jgi:hypothetical protein
VLLNWMNIWSVRCRRWQKRPMVHLVGWLDEPNVGW